MEQTKLNTTYDDLIPMIGKPLVRESVGQIEMLYYISKSSTLADIYYLRNNSVVMISQSHYITPRGLKEFISANGTPTYSVRKYPDDTHDSFHTVIHVWPEKGTSVTAIGEFETASVIREDHFLPMNLKEYISSWGKEYASNSAVIIQKSEPVPTISINQKNALLNGSGIINAEWIVFGLILIICVIYIYKKKLAHK